ncbi:MAG: hypothetical protein ACPGU1_22270 [Myxococcota bacterium]
MIRLTTRLILSLSILLTLTASASAAQTPSKEYIFADLVFDSEVKRPSGEQFNVKGKAKFGRLSYIARPSFRDALMETSAEPVLGSSADRWLILPSASLSNIAMLLPLMTCPTHMAPRE